jgi:plastocyanin
MIRLASIAVLCSMVVCGCSQRTDTPPPTSAPAATPAEPQANANGPGRVEGRVPAPSGGGSVVVVLEPRTAREFAPQDEKPVMDQVGQTFGPDLLLVRTGQPVEFRNSDDTLHNVHVNHDETREPAFNVAIPTGGSYTYVFKRDGFYRVGCDIHPAMAATIYSAATPFAMLAEAGGRFAFDAVPPGAWTVKVYAAGTRVEREVEVHGGVVNVTVE